MLDITKIQTVKIPPSITVLQEANNSLLLRNSSLLDKNERLQKIVIVSVITIGLYTAILILKNIKREQNENSNH